MNSIKRTLLLLFFLTLASFAFVWVYLINEGRGVDKADLKITPLRVLAYPTFVSVYGPGPELVKNFEARCKCKVELLNAGDSALLIEKILAKGEDYAVDVVLGIDQLTADTALSKLKWKSLDLDDVKIDERLKLEGQDALWPLDWAPLTFMRKASQVDGISSIQDLLDPRFKKAVSLQNPMTSTPGRQFFAWVYESLGEEKGLEFFEKLAAQEFVFADTWSASYGLFQKGPMKMSFTYLTSAIYHWQEEKNSDFQPVTFKEALPVQVEYMGVPERCRMCDDAEDFIRFLLEPASQSLIMQKNYMYPAVAKAKVGTVFEKLPEVSILPMKSSMSDEWVKQALERISR